MPPRNLPERPLPLVGRESLLVAIKQHLLEGGHAPILLQGMLGIGKTALAAALVHDPQVRQRYADGILWATLGRDPNWLAILRRWASLFGIRAGAGDVLLSNRLAAHVRDRRMLLVLDDVWNMADLRYLLIGGPRSRSIISTRRLSVANALAASSDDIFKLMALDGAQSARLISMLTPHINGQRLDDLVNVLEGLPLSLHIAGRLVDVETAERALYQHILSAPLPASPQSIRAELDHVLAELSPEARHDFLLLDQLPDTFALTSLEPTHLREWVGDGLLEVVGEGRFHLHALLRAYVQLKNAEK